MTPLSPRPQGPESPPAATPPRSPGRVLPDRAIGFGRRADAGDAPCVVELATSLRGEHATDDPATLSRVASRFLRTWNDGLDDGARQSLGPWAERLARTGASPHADEARFAAVAGWLTGECVTRWLNCAGEPGIARALSASATEETRPADGALIAAIRQVSANGVADPYDRARRETEIQARLASSGCAAAWVACRDWRWTQGCPYQLADPALRMAWYSWLLCWRSLQLALLRDPSAVAGTDLALRRSAFRLLDRILEE